ncbi:DNA repair protein RadA, partial [Bacillus subtilis]|nr:DNA repair protein RadA [Bacillus subtilis]
LSETDKEYISSAIHEMNPAFVVDDSIQTDYKSDITSAPGSVSQDRECTAELIKIAKTKGIPIFIEGHLTKEGTIAGPRLL